MRRVNHGTGIRLGSGGTRLGVPGRLILRGELLCMGRKIGCRHASRAILSRKVILSGLWHSKCGGQCLGCGTGSLPILRCLVIRRWGGLRLALHLRHAVDDAGAVLLIWRLLCRRPLRVLTGETRGVLHLPRLQRRQGLVLRIRLKAVHRLRIAANSSHRRRSGGGRRRRIRGRTESVGGGTGSRILTGHGHRRGRLLRLRRGVGGRRIRSVRRRVMLFHHRGVEVPPVKRERERVTARMRRPRRDRRRGIYLRQLA